LHKDVYLQLLDKIEEHITHVKRFFKKQK